VADSFSWVHGRHAIKFGFEFRRSYNQDVDGSAPSFTFAITPTALPGNSATGNGLASALVGFPTAFSQTIPQALDRHSYYFAGFAQDDWTVKPGLTFNLGLRWETDTPLVDEHNRMNGFDPSQINPVSGTPGVVTFRGLNGTPTAPYHFQAKNFGPRFGFAWKPLHSEKIVVRGG
jgi:outer membrane receptor protein involved in Fe transport